MGDYTDLNNEDRLLHLIEKLDEELGDAHSISTAIQISLKFILSELNRSEGGLVVVERQHSGELYQVWANPHPGWVDPRQSLSDHLIPLIDDVVVSARSAISSDSSVFPVMTGKRVVAALVLDEHDLSDVQVTTLKFLTRMVARKIDYLQTHAVSISRDQFLTLMKIIARGYDPAADIDQVELNFAREISNVFSAEMVSFILPLGDKMNQAEKKVFCNKPGWVEMRNLPFERGLAKQCFENGKLLQWEDARGSAQFSPDLDAIPAVDLKKLVCVPLMVEKKCLGVIAIGNSPKIPLSYSDRSLISILAAAAAAIIQSQDRIQHFSAENSQLNLKTIELTNSRNTLRVLFDSISASIYIIDGQYRIVAINKNRAKRLGAAPKKIIGQVCYQALYDSDRVCPGCQVAATLTNGKNTSRTERTWDKKDRVTDWEVSTYAIFDAKNKPVQAILYEEDITEKRRLEADLIQSEKLAAIGQLAAGVAHEINNPLAAVIANAQLLKQDVPPDNDDMMESVKLIELAGLRASHVVKTMLGLARKEQYEFKPVDLNECIQDALSLLSHEFVARPISIRFERSQGMPPIIASPEHLESVWINLIMNAIEAIGDAKGEININTFHDEGYFYVLIKDSGSGIPSEQLGRIFEPFFTTKGHGRGTGLGLFLVQQIVKAHSGKIQVESETGKGTTFTVILPEKSAFAK